MPRVPTYDSFQSAPSTLPQVQLRSPDMPDVAGAQLQQESQGLMRASDTASRIAQDAQAEANRPLVQNAVAAATKARTDLQMQALQLRGQAALAKQDGKGLPERFTEDFDKQTQGIADGLGNDEQKRQFAAASEQLRTQMYGTLTAHMVDQQQVFRKESYAASNEAFQNQGALLWGDPAMRAQSTEAIRNNVDAEAKASGWDATTRDAELVKQLSPMHVGIVKGMLQAGQGEQARAYVTENSASMTLQARAMAQDMTKGAASLERAQAFADEVTGKGLPQADALALARQRFSGEDEERAVAEVRQRFAENEAARVQNTNLIGRQAWSVLMDKGSMSAIPPDLMAALRTAAPEEERQMRDWLDTKSRREKMEAEGKKADEGFDTYYGLRRMAMDNPQQFADLDLRKSAPYISRPMLESLTDLQGGIARGDAKAMESQRVLKSTLSMIKADVASIGIDLTPKEGTPAAKQTAQFMGALTQSLDQATAAKGAPLTQEEAKRIGAGLLREGIEQGSGIWGSSWGQTKKRGYEIATDPNIAPGKSFVAANYDDIPAATRDQLVAAYRAKKNIGTRILTAQQKADIEIAYTKGIQTGQIK